MDRLTIEKLRGPPLFDGPPHVVILGAGASRAAFPYGDRNGQRLPLINELPDIVGGPWERLVDLGDPPVSGFEAQFAWLRRSAQFERELEQVEAAIVSYFAKLELPDTATIYDYLVLGLRPKDTIATFNWDPLLLAAYRRNRHVGGLPDVRFLHGCVSYRSCANHDVLGSVNEVCPECGEMLVAIELFFPEPEKDYAKSATIRREWDAVVRRLKKAFHLTIFGYSGPDADFNARQLLLSGWRETPLREVTHVEIIDIKDEELLRRCWDEFIPFNHEMVRRQFWDSTIAKWPRRTAEYKISASFYGIPAEPMGAFRTESLPDLQEWHREIAAAEPQ